MKNMVFYVSKPYHCEQGMVWVDVADDPTADTFPYEIVTWQDAVTQNLPIIRCAKCQRPAIQLDCFYPYFSEKNRCADCLATEHAYRNPYAIVKAAPMAVTVYVGRPS